MPALGSPTETKSPGRLAAVLGSNVSRSLSPLLHQAAAQACGFTLQYERISVATPEAFGAALEVLRNRGAVGANVTIPYKAEALSFCTEVSPAAQRMNAVNTVVFSDPTVGDNTDGPGLVSVLQHTGLFRDRNPHVVVLGSGGVARAALWALSQLSARVILSARDSQAGAILAESFGATFSPLENPHPADLVISGLPGSPDVAECCARQWIDSAVQPYVLDLAYGGRHRLSPLAEMAQSWGSRSEDGRALLVEQAARAFCRWFGQSLPPVRAAMFEVLPRLD